MLDPDKPLLSASWIGSSIGAVDMGLFLSADKGMFLSDTITALPSEQLLGSGISEILVIGYLLAGVVALATDLGVMEDM